MGQISNDSKHRPHTHNFLDLSKGENAFADPQFIANLKPYEELGLSYDVWCYGHQLAGLLVAAKAAPGVNLVIDHFGSPIDVAHDDEGYKAWEATMTELAKLPNVYAKISGLMPVLGFDYRSRREKGDDPTAKEIAASRFGEMVKTTVKLFTPARCMFGSNFPVDGAEASYKELVGAYKISFDELGLTDAEKHAIWYETACRFYRVREFAPK